MKKIFFRSFLILVVLICVVILTINITVSSIMADILGDKMGARVGIGSAQVNFMDSQITFHNVSIMHPKGFGRGHLLKFSKVFLDLHPQSLKKKIWHFRKVDVDCREIHVVQSPERKQNWLELGPFKKDDDIEQNNRLTRSGLKSWPIKIDRFTLKLSQATYTDFSRVVPLKRQYTLGSDRMIYKDLSSVKTMLKILGWEAISDIRLIEPPDVFALILGKVEAKLGSREETLKYKLNV
ncbi:MAG: hypothetical protein JW893_07460 [Candidatus Omnitrophica bacterium]|nr:hypothetical protein [Candidatus Omnitrophota bacterium]